MSIQGNAFIKYVFLLNQWAPEKLHALLPKGQIWANVLKLKKTTEKQTKTKHGYEMTFSKIKSHEVLKWTPEEGVRISFPFLGLVTKERLYVIGFSPPG